MRQFYEPEKKFIKALASIGYTRKNENGENIFQHDLGTMILKDIEILKLSITQDRKSVSFSYKKSNSGDEEFLSLESLVKIINVIKYLESEYLLITIPLVDKRDEYTNPNYQEKDPQWWLDMTTSQTLNIDGRKYIGHALFGACKCEMSIDIAEDVIRYCSSVYVITDSLKQLIKDEFVSQEQQNFNKAMRTSRLSIKVAILICIITIVVQICLAVFHCH